MKAPINTKSGQKGLSPCPLSSFFHLDKKKEKRKIPERYRQCPAGPQGAQLESQEHLPLPMLGWPFLGRLASMNPPSLQTFRWPCLIGWQMLCHPYRSLLRWPFLRRLASIWLALLYIDPSACCTMLSWPCFIGWQVFPESQVVSPLALLYINPSACCVVLSWP